MIISFLYKDGLVNNDTFKRVMESIRLDEIPLLFVYCKCPVDLCATRIIDRKPHGGRLDIMPRQEIIKTLDVQNNNFNTITEKIKVYYPKLQVLSIDGSQPARSAAQSIIQILKTSYQYEV